MTYTASSTLRASLVALFGAVALAGCGGGDESGGGA